AGAAVAVVVVAGVGVAVRAPLSRVPENTMKFAVGVMLTSFGVFWGAEGAGASWPGNDAALLAIVPATALVALGYAALLRRAGAWGGAGVPSVGRSAASPGGCAFAAVFGTLSCSARTGGVPRWWPWRG